MTMLTPHPHLLLSGLHTRPTAATVFPTLHIDTVLPKPFPVYSSPMTASSPPDILFRCTGNLQESDG